MRADISWEHSLPSEVIWADRLGEKRYVPPAVQPYWDHRDELVVDGQLILKGHRLVIPVHLRTELMAVTHARDVFIKRRSTSMSQDMKKFSSDSPSISTTEAPWSGHIIVDTRASMSKWAKLGVDLCLPHGFTLLVVCDYFSNYLEVEYITKNVTSRNVIKELSSLFARYNVTYQILWIRTMEPSSHLLSLLALQRSSVSSMWSHHHTMYSQTGRLRMLWRKWGGY